MKPLIYFLKFLSFEFFTLLMAEPTTLPMELVTGEPNRNVEIVMGDLRRILTSTRRQWRKMLATSGVLMSGFFERLPLYLM